MIKRPLESKKIKFASRVFFFIFQLFFIFFAIITLVKRQFSLLLNKKKWLTLA